MTKRLMQHATDTLAPAVSMVGKTKTPTKLVDRFQSLDIAAKVGGPPGVGGGSNRVVRKNTVSGATGQPV